VDTRIDVYAESFVEPYITMFDPPPVEDPMPMTGTKVKGGCQAAPGDASPFALLLALCALALVVRRARS
jgi:uncharacterized protein (TIGR03382 family)